MSTAEIIRAIEEWAAEFERELDRLEKGLSKRIVKLQNALLLELKSVIEWLDFKDKTLLNSKQNIGALRRLDGFFDRFERDQIAAELKLFAEELLSVGELTAKYYVATGSKAIAVEQVLENLRNVIGIDKRGVLLRGGYLYKLGKTMEVRMQLRDYVLNSIVSKRNLSDFQNGMAKLIVGNSGTEGALQQYWRQYAFDTYNQVHEVANKTAADELGLKYFIYQGSIIENTRQFCRGKAGKVFSTDESKDWKDDPDLIEKKTKDSYNPLLERGRYNCRHFLNYISENVAFELRPDLKK